MPPTGSVLHHLPLVEVLLAMGVLAVVSMTLGLLISALVNSSDKTMPLLVVVVMFQVILTGGIFSLAGKTGIEQVAWLSPSRWGFAATASTVNLNVIQEPPGLRASAAQGTAGARPSASTGSTPRPGTTGPAATPSGAAARSPAAGAAAGVTALPTDPIWAHKPTVWLKDIGAMILLGLLFSLLTWWRLIRIKPGRRR